jgi:hypothetical protein
LVDKPKNFYAYLREQNPNTMPGPLLAEVARRLHVSMDDVLADSPDAAGEIPKASLPPDAIPIKGRVTSGSLAEDRPSSQSRTWDVEGLRITVTVERIS